MRLAAAMASIAVSSPPTSSRLSTVAPALGRASAASGQAQGCTRMSPSQVRIQPCGVRQSSAEERFPLTRDLASWAIGPMWTIGARRQASGTCSSCSAGAM
jgi:hypothetical protein